MFDILDKIAELSDANLTIREQERLAENPLDLRYQSIFPPVRATSLKISALTTVDYRPAGGRRDWNAQPREIPEKVGPRLEAEIAPINTSHHIDERRLTELRIRADGIQELVNRGIVGDVNTWPTRLVDAVERQNEAEAFEAWQTKQVTVFDTKTNQQIVVTLDLDATRYITEPTVWSDVSVNAYDRFLFHLEEAQRRMGSVGGARMRRAMAKTILADAPDQPDGVRMTLDGLRDRLEAEGFDGVTVVIDERTYDKFTDGGSATTTDYYVKPGKVLFQPRDGRVGNTHVADVERAYRFLNQAQITAGRANNVVTFKSEQNTGKTLLLEAQKNAATIPEETRVYVVSA